MTDKLWILDKKYEHFIPVTEQDLKDLGWVKAEPTDCKTCGRCGCEGNQMMKAEYPSKICQRYCSGKPEGEEKLK